MGASSLQGVESPRRPENHCRGILQKLFYGLFVKKVESNYRYLVKLLLYWLQSCIDCIWLQNWLTFVL